MYLIRIIRNIRLFESCRPKTRETFSGIPRWEATLRGALLACMHATSPAAVDPSIATQVNDDWALSSPD